MKYQSIQKEASAQSDMSEIYGILGSRDMFLVNTYNRFEAASNHLQARKKMVPIQRGGGGEIVVVSEQVTVVKQPYPP